MEKMKLAELTVETTPQAALQGYVAISHGYLDIADKARFSWVFRATPPASYLDYA